MEMSVAVARNKGITSKNIGNEKPLTSISWLRTFIFSLYSNSCKKKCWPPLFFSHTLSFYSHSSPFLSLDHSTELQATICFHRYPASFAQHCKRLLEAGPGLPLHIYSNAEWRGSCPGTVCVWFGFFFTFLCHFLSVLHIWVVYSQVIMEMQQVIQGTSWSESKPKLALPLIHTVLSGRAF